MLAANHPSLAQRTLTMEREALFRRATDLQVPAADRSPSTVGAHEAPRIGQFRSAVGRLLRGGTGPSVLDRASALGDG